MQMKVMKVIRRRKRKRVDHELTPGGLIVVDRVREGDLVNLSYGAIRNTGQAGETYHFQRSEQSDGKRKWKTPEQLAEHLQAQMDRLAKSTGTEAERVRLEYERTLLNPFTKQLVIRREAK